MEKVILAGVYGKDLDKRAVLVSLDELERLCNTAGAQSVKRVLQKRESADPAYFIGEGKALEIKEIVSQMKVSAVVFDDILKPVQQRNLEKLIGVKILDRVRVIIDIFAFRARTKEGKLQVQRAELTYHLSHLANQGLYLDSQTGGIGTRRGPGEKKLETDKRKIRDDIAAIDEEIEKIRLRREVQRSLRANSDLPEIAICGYTNAGKSTLLKTLANSSVYSDDKLFATLDPLTRKVKLPSGRFVLFSDTVGFISKLPHDLVEAFKSTMEEILRAGCILHIVDASSEQEKRKREIDTVINVLKEIGADKIPLITVYNKADKLDKYEKAILSHNACVISAKDGLGIESLLCEIEKIVLPKHQIYRLSFKYGRQNILGNLYKFANVKEVKYNKKSATVIFETSRDNYDKIVKTDRHIDMKKTNGKRDYDKRMKGNSRQTN
ncbi:MAG: GTPase HflX [Endomicrobium sp.]|jgi:GTP-binding protein HflX|nr:GTPase HflX [Endomicrobium sp.]